MRIRIPRFTFCGSGSCPHQSDTNLVNIRYTEPPRLHLEPLRLRCELLRPFTIPLWAPHPQLLSFDSDGDPEPTFGFDADPDPAYHADSDPDQTSQNDTSQVNMAFPNLRIISSFSRPWNPSTVRISTSSNPAPSQIRLLNQEQNFQIGPNQDFSKNEKPRKKAT